MKIVLDDVNSGYNLSAINDNFEKIEQALQDEVLYRNNPVGEPNSMQNALDMNANRIINLPEPQAPTDPLRVQDVSVYTGIVAGTSFVQGTPPGSALNGNRWYDTSSGRTYVYYDDGDSAQWVEDNPQNGGGGAGIISVSGYAAVRAYADDAASLYVAGRSSPFDGGHGYFQYDPLDTVSADNGMTILVDAMGRRWKRQYSGEVNLLWAAVGDGITDDYPALVKAHDALPPTGGVVYAPGGRSYLINGNFIASRPFFKLRGDGDAVTEGGLGCTTFIKPASVSGALVTLTGHGSTLEMFAIRGEAGNVGDGIHVLAGRCSIKRVSSNRCGNDGLRIGSDVAGSNCNLWVVEDFKARGNGRCGIAVDDKPLASPGLADANGGVFRGGDLQNNAWQGLYVGNAQFNTFTQVASQSIRLGPNAGDNVILGGGTTGSVTDVGTNNTIFGVGGASGYYGLKLANRNSHLPTVLDWYEEVDWSSSATLSFITAGNLSVAYATKTCTAQRIGNEVTARFVIMTSTFTHTTASGSLLITGLPFTPAAGNYSAGPLQYQGINIPTKPSIVVQANPGSAAARLVACGPGVGLSEVSAADMPSGGTVVLIGEVRYRCA